MGVWFFEVTYRDGTCVDLESDEDITAELHDDADASEHGGVELVRSVPPVETCSCRDRDCPGAHPSWLALELEPVEHHYGDR